MKLLPIRAPIATMTASLWCWSPCVRLSAALQLLEPDLVWNESTPNERPDSAQASWAESGNLRNLDKSLGRLTHLGLQYDSLHNSNEHPMQEGCILHRVRNASFQPVLASLQNVGSACRSLIDLLFSPNNQIYICLL
eukprot:1159496-Pelagomonas_calceolata.AAC.6